MTIDFGFEDKKPKGERDEKIVKIMEQFSGLSPEKQEEVMKFIEFLEKHPEEKTGQDHST